MLSDIEKLDVTLGENSLERDESNMSNSGRRPDSPSYNYSGNQDINSHSNSREGEIRSYSQNGQITSENSSNSELNRLPGELTQRNTQEMGDFMTSVSSQIQRAIHEAINEQILPQIQATLRSQQGQVPESRWEVPASSGFRSSFRDELPGESIKNDDLENTHDIYQNQTQD